MRLESRFARLSAILIAVMSVTACSPIGIGIGAAATVADLATQERGLITAVDDNLIWISVNEHLLDHDAALFRRVQIQVHEGRVLMTGHVAEQEHRLSALRAAWKAGGVREVINEIKIANSRGVDDLAQDEFLISRLRVKLLVDAQVRANNYSIECIDSVIYLIGVAQNRTELQRVIDHARDISYVRAVVSYVRLESDPLPPRPERPPIEIAGEGTVAVMAGSDPVALQRAQP